MPCTDGGVPFPPSREEVLNDKVPVPMLCALLTQLTTDGTLQGHLEDIDWKEAGITRAEFKEWWSNHKRRDAERRAREDAGKLPRAVYKLRQDVEFDGRKWMVIRLATAKGGLQVTMVTIDDRMPTRNQTFLVRKA